jgi:hypothetical protein
MRPIDKPFDDFLWAIAHKIKEAHQMRDLAAVVCAKAQRPDLADVDFKAPDARRVLPLRWKLQQDAALRRLLAEKVKPYLSLLNEIDGLLQQAMWRFAALIQNNPGWAEQEYFAKVRLAINLNCQSIMRDRVKIFQDIEQINPNVALALKNEFYPQTPIIQDNKTSLKRAFSTQEEEDRETNLLSCDEEMEDLDDTCVSQVKKRCLK